MKTIEQTTEHVLSKLLAAQPKLHRHEGESYDWHIQESTLEWLAVNVKSHFHTLETGTGYSTVIFSATGSQHTAISPSREEHKAIRDWCISQKIDSENVVFYPEMSQFVLPALEKTPLDVVLIDGGHAFPFPYIDWYYTSIRLKKGGYLLLDDVQIKSVEIMKDFLISEKDRWSYVDQLGKTTLFQKKTEEAFAAEGDWQAQSFCSRFNRPKQSIKSRIRSVINSI